MIEIISTHPIAKELFRDGILARLKTDVAEPVEYLIDKLDGKRGEDSKMILGLLNEAILHNTLYYTRNGVTTHYELL